MTSIANKVAWPGRPGGYEPVVAHQMAQERATKGGWASAAPAKKAANKIGHRSIHGISKKADESIVRYEANAIAQEKRKQARKASRKE